MFGHSRTMVILLDMMALGISAGLYIVPLYVILQEFSETKTRSRVIAGNNISNAFFMVFSAVIILLLLNNHVAIETIFLLLSITNLFISGFLYFYFAKEIAKISQ